jgi:hypothetical protein
VACLELIFNLISYILYRACNWCSLLNSSGKGLAKGKHKRKLTNFSDTYWNFWKSNSQPMVVHPLSQPRHYYYTCKTQGAICVLVLNYSNYEIFNLRFVHLFFWNKCLIKHCWFLVMSSIFHMQKIIYLPYSRVNHEPKLWLWQGNGHHIYPNVIS